ncbi:hypothetical protein NE237_004751 [Protea cynaroides]|uniref:CCHC-type domain-containing protein n=1 Tax=Protea cynaroides TaxID=273540 RepID=A0A9Q0QTX3_9MAGN|nr:hypothetical protein NE237_004751 [Protea cynaroides]
MMGAFTTFMGFMQQQATRGGIPVGQPAQQDQMGVMEKVLKMFHKQNPQIFRGTANEPLQVVEWLRNMERIFEVMECTEAQKLVCASHVLLGEADIWWQTSKKILEANGRTSTWVEFLRMFEQKYYPSSFKRAKQTEFLHFTQGYLTLQEYVQKFDKLSQFAPPATTDESKVRQFEEGLREDIRGSVSMPQLPTYAAVLEKAMILDACSSRGSRTGDKTLGKRIMDRRDFNEPQKFQRDLRERLLFPTCPTYGKLHRGVCRAGLGVCFRCGKEGHMVRECPMPDPRGTQGVGQLVASGQPPR